MNKVLLTLLVGAFILTGSSYAQNPPPAPIAAPADTTEPTKPAVHHEQQRHPELHKAMRKLRAAKQDLEKATKDYGGHKAKAIEAIDKALEELKAAVDSEKK